MRTNYFIHLCIVGILSIYTQFSFSNGLSISNLSRDSTNQTVSFDIHWYNSWNVATTGEPYNWDAAWVFVKFRECGAAATTEWTHGKIDINLASNSFGSLSATKADGSSGIDADSNGVMLMRSSEGIYPDPSSGSVTLKVSNIPSSGSYDVKVFGIEMVFVPQASFQLGDGSSAYSLNNGSGAAQTISSESSVLIYSANSGFTSYKSRSATTAANFPKGYKAFYCMKYEISAGQYAAFLNTITTNSQLNRFPDNYGSYRHPLTDGGTYPDEYYTTSNTPKTGNKDDRALNYLSFYDLFSYLDWACLRPMTELEFEKACRGTATAIADEYAWGSNTITQAKSISLSPEDGTEVIYSSADANASYGSVTYTGGDAGQGPLRVGIFAEATDSTRQTTGASYYGIMEMSGNVYEVCINYENTSFDASLGNGYLSTAGQFNVSTWPTTGSYKVTIRGGSWLKSSSYLKVSDRSYESSTYWTTRQYDIGGRGVRSK